jgi:hypothetical protein
MKDINSATSVNTNNLIVPALHVTVWPCSSPSSSSGPTLRAKAVKEEQEEGLLRANWIKQRALARRVAWLAGHSIPKRAVDGVESPVGPTASESKMMTATKSHASHNTLASTTHFTATPRQRPGPKRNFQRSGRRMRRMKLLRTNPSPPEGEK